MKYMTAWAWSSITTELMLRENLWMIRYAAITCCKDEKVCSILFLGT